MWFPSHPLFSAHRTVVVLGKVLERMGCVVLLLDDHVTIRVDVTREAISLKCYFHADDDKEDLPVVVHFRRSREDRRSLRRDRYITELYDEFFSEVAEEFERVVDMYSSSVEERRTG